METIRPGFERGAGDVARGCWKGTAGDTVAGKGCRGTPPAAPWGEDGGRWGWDVRAAEDARSGKGHLCPLGAARRGGKGAEDAQLRAIPQPKRVKRGDWRWVVLPLARFYRGQKKKKKKIIAAAPTPDSATGTVTDWGTESYNHRVN